MIQIKSKLDCCGCTACTNSCPKSAIAMVPDEEGFLYPKIDMRVHLVVHSRLWQIIFLSRMV